MVPRHVESCPGEAVCRRGFRGAVPVAARSSIASAVGAGGVVVGADILGRDGPRRRTGKAALGLPLDHRGIPHVCLAEFRARLLRAEMVSWLHDKFLVVAKRAGVIGHRRAVDSTGIADSVLTQDTVTLIR